MVSSVGIELETFAHDILTAAEVKPTYNNMPAFFVKFYAQFTFNEIRSTVHTISVTATQAYYDKPCKSLLATGSIALHNSVFGQVAPVTPIHHGHVYCTGDESKLAECSLGSSHGCHSNQNAGVRCHGKTGMHSLQLHIVASSGRTISPP